MVVGNWITEPELHAHHRRGWGSRWRLDSFSARLRFGRLGCVAAQVAVAKGEEVMKALPKKLLPLTLFAIAVTSVFSLLLAADTPKDEAAKKALEQLQGTWQAVSLNDNGKPESAEVVKKTNSTING